MSCSSATEGFAIQSLLALIVMPRKRIRMASSPLAAVGNDGNQDHEEIGCYSQHPERCDVNDFCRVRWRCSGRPGRGARGAAIAPSGGAAMELKLAAMLAAEVVGLSRLLRQDEAAILAALQAHHHALIDRAIATHRGRIVELAVERTLVAFEVVLDAMECALAIQRGMALRNQALPPERRILLRAGLDHRDVVVDRGDVSGPAVQVACLLRDLAEPGGLCIADTVFLQVRRRVRVGFEGLGVHQLQGLAQPVRAIRVVGPSTASAASRRRWRWRR
jgi:class 3 adenylate cyclase